MGLLSSVPNHQHSRLDVHYTSYRLLLVLPKEQEEEFATRFKQNSTDNKETKAQQINIYQRAIQANRQLAVALQEQGLNEMDVVSSPINFTQVIHKQ